MAINELTDREAAEKEWKALLAENANRFDERSKLLREEGVHSHLDGENHFKDIDEWFNSELAKIKKKYNIA